jgi:hypothetical protein
VYARTGEPDQDVAHELRADVGSEEVFAARAKAGTGVCGAACLRCGALRAGAEDAAGSEDAAAEEPLLVAEPVNVDETPVRTI